MTAQGIAQIVLYFAVLVALAKPLGAYMARVYQGERTFLSPVFATDRSAGSIALPASTRRGVELEALCARPCCSSTSSASSSSTCCSACRRAAAEPAGFRAPSAPTPRSTPR